jgi:predicted acetyltransferase
MTGAPFRFRPLRADEARAAARRTQLSFGATRDLEELTERWRQHADDGGGWVLADAQTDAVLAQTVLRSGPHWFGGREVPCQRVGGVAVAPEHRGAGVATALMAEALRHGAAAHAGLSLLFPATVALYRGLGYEYAGAFVRWEVNARAVAPEGPGLRPLDDEWAAVAACHRRWAATLNGPELRDERRWNALREQSQFAYGLDAADGSGLDAYVLLRHEAIPGHWQHRLELVDWAAASPRALQAVVGFVGRHGTLARDARFRAPTPNPWALHIAEQDLVRASDFDWMARGVDLVAAVTARGFPEALAGSVTVAVDDPLLDAARGPWRLEIAGGRGALEPAAAADVRLHTTAVGPLFTGYWTASALAAAGRLTGPAGALRLLDAAFAGPTPTLLDFF